MLDLFFAAVFRFFAAGRAFDLDFTARDELFRAVLAGLLLAAFFFVVRFTLLRGVGGVD